MGQHRALASGGTPCSMREMLDFGIPGPAGPSSPWVPSDRALPKTRKQPRPAAAIPATRWPRTKGSQSRGELRDSSRTADSTKQGEERAGAFRDRRTDGQTGCTPSFHSHWLLAAEPLAGEAEGGQSANYSSRLAGTPWGVLLLFPMLRSGARGAGARLIPALPALPPATARLPSRGAAPLVLCDKF